MKHIFDSFITCHQKYNQNIDQYVTILKQKAGDCICGIISDNLREKLLGIKNFITHKMTYVKQMKNQKQYQKQYIKSIEWRLGIGIFMNVHKGIKRNSKWRKRNIYFKDVVLHIFFCEISGWGKNEWTVWEWTIIQDVLQKKDVSECDNEYKK